MAATFTEFIDLRCASTWSTLFSSSNSCRRSTWWTAFSRTLPSCRSCSVLDFDSSRNLTLVFRRLLIVEIKLCKLCCHLVYFWWLYFQLFQFCIKCFHQGGYVIVLVCWFDLCEIFEGIFWGDLDLGIFFLFSVCHIWIFINSLSELNFSLRCVALSTAFSGFWESLWGSFLVTVSIHLQFLECYCNVTEVHVQMLCSLHTNCTL